MKEERYIMSERKREKEANMKKERYIMSKRKREKEAKK